MAVSVKNSSSRINVMSQQTRAVSTCVYLNINQALYKKIISSIFFTNIPCYYKVFLLHWHYSGLLAVHLSYFHLPCGALVGKTGIYSLITCSERSTRFGILHFIIFSFITEMKTEPELPFPVCPPSGPLNWGGRGRKCVSAGGAVCHLVPVSFHPFWLVSLGPFWYFLWLLFSFLF